MPTIDVNYAEFIELLGIELPETTEIDDILTFVKGEVKFFDKKEGVMNIEIKDTNRPDLWNIEGLTRTLRGFLCIEKGMRRYAVKKSEVKVQVDHRLKDIRPYIGCSIVKSVKLTDTAIRGLMHLQDKLDQTYGRNREKTSIGIYDYRLITQPLNYTVAKPDEYSLVPLNFEENMTLEEILKHHPKGIEYGHIVKKHNVYPILLDSKKKVLSFPPIINSNDLGKVTETTEDVLVEVTGTNLETVLNALTFVTLSLVDRGGEGYSAEISYPSENLKMITPDFKSSLMGLTVQYVNKILGLQLTSENIAEMLGKAGFGIKKFGCNKLIVQIPCFRTDVMHPIDLVEDIAIAYGYNNIKPLWRPLPTIGGLRSEQNLLNIARDLMIGLGFQEVLTYTLTNTENLCTKMNLEKVKAVEIANPKVQTFTCLRNWLLPSLMEILSNNKSVEYPQKIFELGKVTLFDDKQETKTRDEEWLAAAISHANASFTEIKSNLASFFMNFGLEWQILETKHPSFIDGRTGIAIVEGKKVGIFGEINPKILEAWTLENPVAAFELTMGKIAKIKYLR